MSWLSEHIHPKPIRRLAEELLKRKDWPKTLPLGRDTLRNYLSHADSGSATGWWLHGKGKPAMQPLSKLLGLSVDELTRRMQQPAATEASSTRIEVDVFDGVFIDLEKDETFLPGFPTELSANGGRNLDCAWWTTGDSVAAVWLAQWMEARFDWHRITMDTWSPAVLPSTGKVLVELKSVDGMKATWPTTVPVETRVCIVSRHAQPMPDDAAESKSREPSARSSKTSVAPEQGRTGSRLIISVTSPPAREWLDELIAWLSPRVPAGGRLKEQSARRLTHAEYGGAAQAEPREVLSFLELVVDHDETHFGGDRRRLIRAWVGNAEARDVPENRRVLASYGDEVLLALNSTRLREALPAALSIEQWKSLLPPSFVPARVRTEVENRTRDGGTANAARLWKLLDPERIDWVDGLLRCGVLAAGDDGLVSIQPPLLARFVDDFSFSALWAMDDGFGSLMLNSTTAVRAIHTLIGEFLAGDFARAERWLLANETTVERLAACDGIFRAIGFVLTIPNAAVPLELVRRAWDLYVTFSGEIYRHSPRVPFVTVGLSPDARGLNSEGGHYLAASAISVHLLRAGDALPPSVLTPTRELIGTRENQAWGSNYWEPARRVFRLITKAFHDAAPGSNEQLAPHRLGEQLLEHVGRTLVYELSDLQQAAAIARYPTDAAAATSLGHARSIALDAVEDSCARHNISLEHALSRAWEIWARRDFDYGIPPLAPRTAGALFSNLTRAHLDAANRWLREEVSPPDPERSVSLQQLKEHPEVWPFLKPEIWDYAIETWTISAAMLKHVPASAARTLLRRHPWWAQHTGVAPSDLWSAFPELVVEYIHDIVLKKAEAAYWPLLAFAAPGTSTHELVQRLSEHHDAFIHEWFVTVVEARNPGWRVAAQHLVEYAISEGGAPPASPLSEFALPRRARKRN